MLVKCFLQIFYLRNRLNLIRIDRPQDSAELRMSENRSQKSGGSSIASRITD